MLCKNRDWGDNMKLNLEKGYISVDDFNNIDISKLKKVGLIDIDFRNVKITFVYLYDGYYSLCIATL